MDEPLHGPESMRKAYALGFPINLTLELGIQFLAMLGPAALLVPLAQHATVLSTTLRLVVAWYTYPLVLLLLTASALRLLPKPPIGYLHTQGQRLRYQTLIALTTFMRRTPARWLLIFPFPGYLFYKIAGTRISPTALITHPDSLPDPFLVSIGADTVLGWGCLVTGHYAPSPSQMFLGRVSIGSGVMVGVQALVWPNVQIGNGAVIQNHAVVAAGTIVPPNEIWGGVPAKKVGVVKVPSDRMKALDPERCRAEVHRLVEAILGVPAADMTPLLQLGLEARDVTGILKALEQKYEVMIDRTELDIQRLSVDGVVSLASGATGHPS